MTEDNLLKLIEAKDYKALLRYYHYCADSKEDEIGLEHKAATFNFLSKNLGMIEPLLHDSESVVRKHAIEFLKDIRDRQGLLFLLQGLLKEERSDIQMVIKDALCEAEAIEEIQDELLKVVENVAGKRFDLLAEVISFINDPSFLRSVLSKIKNRCPLEYETCGRDVVPEESFFVGHFFSRENIDDLRPRINEAVKYVLPDCKPYYANDDLGNELLCKVCEKIQKTRFGIYDITIAPDKDYPNPNVMLEIGMSKAFGKKTIIIMKAGQEPPSDLRGQVLILYESKNNLSAELSRLLPGKLLCCGQAHSLLKLKD